MLTITFYALKRYICTNEKTIWTGGCGVVMVEGKETPTKI
jgi:hypothetical protein